MQSHIIICPKISAENWFCFSQPEWIQHLAPNNEEYERVNVGIIKIPFESHGRCVGRAFGCDICRRQRREWQPLQRLSTEKVASSSFSMRVWPRLTEVYFHHT